MNKVKGGPVRLVSDEPRRQAPTYAAMGLDEASLRQLLIDEADRRVGETIGVAFPGRGAVLWHEGRISLLGQPESAAASYAMRSRRSSKSWISGLEWQSEISS
jgi:hypothetical protein